MEIGLCTLGESFKEYSVQKFFVRTMMRKAYDCHVMEFMDGEEEKEGEIRR